jgi:Kef-type K+ transport system membrane component KefB
MTRALALLALLFVMASAARSFAPDAAPGGAGRILAFGFLLLASVQMGHVMSPLRLPKLTGFLVAGAIFGPEALGIITPEMIIDLSLVKKVSVGLIALLAGCELNAKALRPKLTEISSSTLSTFFLPVVLLSVGIFFSSDFLPVLAEMEVPQRIVVCLLCGVTLATFSPAVVVALLSELKAAGPVSELTLSVVVLADLLVTIFFTIIIVVVRAFFPESGGSFNVGEFLFHLFGSLGIGAILGLLFSVYIQRVKDWIGLFIFGVLFVVAEAGSVLHLDPLLVGLSAGLFLENVSPVSGHEVIHKTEPATMPSFAIFFAVVGAELKLGPLLEVGAFAAVVALLRAFGVWWGTRVGGRLGKTPPEVSRGLFFGLVSQAGVAIAFSGIIRASFSGWGERVATFLMGVIIINQLLGPILFRSALLRTGEVNQKKDDSSATHAPHIAPPEEISYGDQVKGA